MQNRQEIVAAVKKRSIILIDIETKNQIDNFTKLLTSCEEYTDFLHYVNEKQNNDELISLRKDFAEQRRYNLENQNKGTITDEDVQNLKSIQEQITNNEIVQNLFKAQDRLIKVLQSCNLKISNEIGLDFAQNAAPAACCS